MYAELRVAALLFQWDSEAEMIVSISAAIWQSGPTNSSPTAAHKNYLTREFYNYVEFVDLFGNLPRQQTSHGVASQFIPIASYMARWSGVGSADPLSSQISGCFRHSSLFV